MELNLHANGYDDAESPRLHPAQQEAAGTGGRTGVSETTIYRWRGRTTVTDRSHTPKTLTTSLSTLDEVLVCELRTRLQLPLHDIAEVMRRCVNAKLSPAAPSTVASRGMGSTAGRRPSSHRSGSSNRRPSPSFTSISNICRPWERRKSYAFVAIDRATRYVYLEIHPKRDAETAAGFLERFLTHFPHRVQPSSLTTAASSPIASRLI
jgi:hypothetical protein